MNLFDELGYGTHLHVPSPKSIYKATARLTESNTCTNPKEFKIKITIPAAAVNAALSKGKNLEVLITIYRIKQDGKVFIRTDYSTKSPDACAYWQSICEDYPEFMQEYITDLYSCAVKYLENNSCLKPYSHLLHFGKDSVLHSTLVA